MPPLAPIVMSFLVGAALALQPSINAVVAGRLGAGIWGVVFSLAISLLAALVWIAATRPPVHPGALLSAPWWVWTSGLIGTLMLLTGLSVTPQIGAAAFFFCLIVGQLVGSTLADHFGLVGLERRPLTWDRALGIALMAAGALFALRERG